MEARLLLLEYGGKIKVIVIGIWRQDKGFKAHLTRLSHIFYFLKIVENPSNPGSERVKTTIISIKISTFFLKTAKMDIYSLAFCNETRSNDLPRHAKRINSTHQNDVSSSDVHVRRDRLFAPVIIQINSLSFTAGIDVIVVVPFFYVSKTLIVVAVKRVGPVCGCATVSVTFLFFLMGSCHNKTQLSLQHYHKFVNRASLLSNYVNIFAEIHSFVNVFQCVTSCL
jgi:hypothetical protein